MKKFIFFILPLLFIFSCIKPKEVIEETYPDGSKKIVRFYKGQGKEKVLVKEVGYYPNKKKHYEGEFMNNQRDGKWTYWFDNGNLWSEGYLKKDLNARLNLQGSDYLNSPLKSRLIFLKKYYFYDCLIFL